MDLNSLVRVSGNRRSVTADKLQGTCIEKRHVDPSSNQTLALELESRDPAQSQDLKLV